MAGIFQPGGLLGPIAPGMSGAVNPLAFIGAGMATGDMGAQLARMGQLQQQAAQLRFQQEQQQQRLAAMQQAAAAQQRMAAMAPRMFPGDPVMQEVAAINPSMIENLYLQQRKAAMPTSGMQQFAAYQQMPAEQQQRFLEYQRAMSPFAGAQAFMSPLGAKAEKWKNEGGESPSPAMTAQQATQAGFRPTSKPTEKQQDVAAFVQNAETAEKMLGELEGWTSAGTLAARNPISRLLTSEKDKRASDFQLAWTMAVLRAESGAVISPAEAEQQIQVYFEQPGDTEQQKRDKKKLRKAKMETMRQRAGEAYTPLEEPSPDDEVQRLMDKYLP